MSRARHKLTASQVLAASKPGSLGDGAGLFLKTSTGKVAGKRWVLIYQSPTTGKRREMGLGGCSPRTLPEARGALAQARDKADAARALVASGVDPIETKNEVKSVPTFAEMVADHVAAHASTWRNETHRRQWTTSLETHAKRIWSKPVDHITTDDVLAVLTPIWHKIPETASRVRGRIEIILDAAKVRGFRDGENPSRWRGHLAHLLPPRKKLMRGHMPAMAIDDVPALMKSLRDLDTISARCLEFIILTACRSGEAIGARWSEIDFEAAIWTLPGERMKSGREHRVPLTNRAIEILRGMEPLQEGDVVFPGQRRGRSITGNALWRALKGMGFGAPCVHGMRSTFRQWAAEQGYPRDMGELALAHYVGSEVERAYQRSDMLERRRAMMVAWADFLRGEALTPNVVKLRTER
jgi:integrase